MISSPVQSFQPSRFILVNQTNYFHSALPPNHHTKKVFVDKFNNNDSYESVVKLSACSATSSYKTAGKLCELRV